VPKGKYIGLEPIGQFTN